MTTNNNTTTKQPAKFIDRPRVCGHLKNLFISGGELKVKDYQDYVKKELNKKRISLNRFQEMQEIDQTITWWMSNVMKHYDRSALQSEKAEKENKKAHRIASYFASQIINGAMSLEDIKSDIYREMVKDIFDEMPFGMPENGTAQVMADKVQETVLVQEPEERIIDKKEPERIVTYKDNGDVRIESEDHVVYIYKQPDGLYTIDWYEKYLSGGTRALSRENRWTKDAVEYEFDIKLSQEEQKEESKEENFSHGLKVGDVLYASWGYDQTNLDFFIIVSATEKSIRIKECTMEKTYESSEGYSSMSRMIAFDPKTAKPVEESWMIKDQQGKGDLRKIQYYEYNGQKNMYIKFKPSYGLLQKYEGTKLYESWYA